MSKKVNPASVGIFVTGAIFILLAGAVALGSGKFFEKRKKFVVYFQSDANGLDIGSDVKLAGVKVGRVDKMQVQFDPDTNAKVIPVVIDISAKRIAALSVDGAGKDEILSRQSVDRAINNDGLRARLMTQSPLTGQLYVDLDFFPKGTQSYRFPGTPIEGLQQIPTTKSEIEKVLESIAQGVDKLSKIDITGMADKVEKLLVNLDTKVEELDFKGISERTNDALDQIDDSFAKLQEILGDENLVKAIANFEEATAHFKVLVEEVDAERFNELLTTTNETLEEIKLATANIADLSDPDSAMAIRLKRTLAGLDELSRSMSDLASFLRRNPNSVITGRKGP